MDELNDLVAEAKSVISRMDLGGVTKTLPPGFLLGLREAAEAAEALLAKWADEEGRLADRES